MTRVNTRDGGGSPRAAVLVSLMVGAALAAFAVAWLLGSASRGAAPPLEDRLALLERYLELSPRQVEAVRSADPSFVDESARLVDELKIRRARLAATLTDPASTDADIQARLDAAMETESTLERRVGTFVLRVRPRLDEPQRRQLLGLIAAGLSTNAGPHLQDDGDAGR